MIADAERKGLKVAWPGLVINVLKFAEYYQLTADDLLYAFAESSESTADTAMAAVSMINSSSHFHDLFNKDLASRVGSFSEHLTVQIPEK